MRRDRRSNWSPKKWWEKRGCLTRSDVRTDANDEKEVTLIVMCQDLYSRSCAFCQPAAPSRAQPQVLVPQVLVPPRTCAPAGLAPQPLSVTTSKIQQGQQRACVLTASVKGAQTVVATANQRRPDSGRAPPCVMQPAPVPNGSVPLNSYSAKMCRFLSH